MSDASYFLVLTRKYAKKQQAVWKIHIDPNKPKALFLRDSFRSGLKTWSSKQGAFGLLVSSVFQRAWLQAVRSLIIFPWGRKYTREAFSGHEPDLRDFVEITTISWGLFERPEGESSASCCYSLQEISSSLFIACRFLGSVFVDTKMEQEMAC